MLQREREEQLAGAELKSRSQAAAAFKWSYFKHSKEGSMVSVVWSGRSTNEKKQGNCLCCSCHR